MRIFASFIQCCSQCCAIEDIFSASSTMRKWRWLWLPAKGPGRVASMASRMSDHFGVLLVKFLTDFLFLTRASKFIKLIGLGDIKMF